MANDLHERVATVLWDMIERDCDTDEMAAAVIPMILEEAAKVADHTPLKRRLATVPAKRAKTRVIRAQEETK